MIPGVSLVQLIETVSIIGVAVIIFAESGLLIGFFLPGDSLLFTTGFLISASILPVNIHLTVFILAIAAIAGDSVGYAIGYRAGKRLFRKPDARIFKQEYVEQARVFFEKYGGKTVLLARFVPVVRTFAPLVAGASKMKYRRFLSFNVIGALLWAAGITYAGYFLGRWFKSMGISIDEILLPVVLAIIVLSSLPPLIHVLSNKSRREGVFQIARGIWKQITRR